MPHLGAFSTAGWLNDRKRSAAVADATRSVQLKSTGLGQLVGNLSGGNQQKIVLARWLTQHCSVLLLDEPTRGVDVGARGEIYTIVRDLAAKGLTVILVSSDMPELIGLSHRVHGHAQRRRGRRTVPRRDSTQPTRRNASSAIASGQEAMPPERHPTTTRLIEREDAMSTTADPVTALPPPDAAPRRANALRPDLVDQLRHPQLDGDRAAAGDGVLQLPQRALRHPGERTHHPGGCRARSPWSRWARPSSS